MNMSVQELLDSFDRLSQSEQWEIAAEILKRTISSDFPALTDEEQPGAQKNFFWNWTEVKQQGISI